MGKIKRTYGCLWCGAEDWFFVPTDLRMVEPQPPGKCFNCGESRSCAMPDLNIPITAIRPGMKVWGRHYVNDHYYGPQEHARLGTVTKVMPESESFWWAPEPSVRQIGEGDTLTDTYFILKIVEH